MNVKCFFLSWSSRLKKFKLELVVTRRANLKRKCHSSVGYDGLAFIFVLHVV